MINNNYLFINGCHKSGSTLLRSLFHGHPNCAVVPVELHLLPTMGSYTANPLHYQKPQQFTNSEIKNRILDHLKRYELSTSKLADASQLTSINSTVELNINNNNSINDILCYYIKYTIDKYTRYLISPNNLTVEKSVTNSEFSLVLKEIFPNSKFIHIVRNPYSHITSLRKYNSLSSGKGPYFQRILELLLHDYNWLQKNKTLLKEEYLIVKYEDIIADAERTMRRISEFANIPYSDVLLRPQDEQNKTWKGNSTRSINHDGLSSEMLYNWQNDIHGLEIQIVNNFLDFFIEMFDYNKFNIKGNPYIPFKGEGAIRYILNRTLNKRMFYLK